MHDDSSTASVPTVGDGFGAVTSRLHTGFGRGGGGGGGSASPSAPTPAAGDKAGVVSANHGHIAIVMAAQLTAGNAVNLDIHGTADHTHTVQLSADQVRAIALGMRITVRSSADQAHDHDVTFS